MLCSCGCGKEANHGEWIRCHWCKSKEIRERLSNVNKGKPKSEEHRRKLSNALMGHKTWNKGIPRPEETRRKISDTLKGHPSPKKGLTKDNDVGIKRTSEKLKGKIRTAGHCENISQAKKGCKAWNKGYGDYIRGNKHPLWGKHHSEGTKLKISITNSGKRRSPNTEFKKGGKGKTGKSNGMYGKSAPRGSGWGKGSYYQSPLQGKVWLRSSYELAYVKYLDSKSILWLYEFEKFDLGNITYTPDFFLPQFEKFIEIKGWVNSKSMKRVMLFQKQYPFNVEILNREDLLSLGVLV